MRTCQTPNLPAELGYQILVAVCLGVDAYREREAKLFGPKTQKGG